MLLAVEIKRDSTPAFVMEAGNYLVSSAICYAAFSRAMVTGCFSEFKSLMASGGVL